MSAATALLAVEDMLSEIVSRKILADFSIEVSQTLGLRGK